MAKKPKKSKTSDNQLSGVSPGGSSVLRHEATPTRPGDPLVVFLSEQEMTAVHRHFEAAFGPSPSVMHEIVSEGVHLDMLTAYREEEAETFTAICTMGVSAVPMQVPPMESGEEGDAPSPYAELFMLLPGRWPTTQKDIEAGGDQAWWPYRVLKECAHIPDTFGTWLGVGHTIPNGDPPVRYDGCPFSGVMVMHGDPILKRLELKGKAWDFLLVIPLYAEEMTLKLEEGVEALLERWEEHDIGPLNFADPERPNVAGD